MPIRTLADLRKEQGPPPNPQPAAYQGGSGTTSSVPTAEPVPFPTQWQQSAPTPSAARGTGEEPFQYSSITQSSQNVPAIDLGYTQIEVSPAEFQARPFRTSLLLCCCPCCVGNPCSERHLTDLKAAARTFIAFITAVDIIMYLSELALMAEGSGSDGFLAPSVCTLSKLGGGGGWLVTSPNLQIWRLLTPVFLHAGPLHILMNMYVQLLAGMRCEFSWGAEKTALVYFASGIGGCLLSAAVAPAEMGVGASGAIVGLVAAQFVQVLSTWKARPAETRKRQACNFGIFLFILVVFGKTNEHVDNSAHFGGLIVGALLSLCLWGDASDCVCDMRSIGCSTTILRYFAALALFGFFVGSFLWLHQGSSSFQSLPGPVAVYCS